MFRLRQLNAEIIEFEKAHVIELSPSVAMEPLNGTMMSSALKEDQLTFHEVTLKEVENTLFSPLVRTQANEVNANQLCVMMNEESSSKRLKLFSLKIRSKIYYF